MSNKRRRKMFKKLNSKKGEAILAAYAVFGLIALSFANTVVNGTFVKQVDKIAAAHKADITIDTIESPAAPLVPYGPNNYK